MRKGIAVAGNLTVDYLKVVDSYPQEGNLSTILSLQKSVGGAPCNVSLDLSSMDPSIPLQVIGLTGCDADGEYLIELLKSHNIHTGLIQRDPFLKTSFTDVISIASTGARTFFHYRGANASLSEEHFHFDEIDAEMLHIGYALLLDTLDDDDSQYGTKMARVLHRAQMKGLKTSLDVVTENSSRFSTIIPPSLPYCHYCIINELEASYTTDIPVRGQDGRLMIDHVERVCKTLFSMGVNELVAVHAPEGGFAMDAAGDFYVQPALQLPADYIRGTVGAGDAFCAGMLYSSYQDWDIPKALQTAVGAAASCLSHINSTEGVKDIAGIHALFAETEKKKL